MTSKSDSLNELQKCTIRLKLFSLFDTFGRPSATEPFGSENSKLKWTLHGHRFEMVEAMVCLSLTNGSELSNVTGTILCQLLYRKDNNEIVYEDIKMVDLKRKECGFVHCIFSTKNKPFLHCGSGWLELKMRVDVIELPKVSHIPRVEMTSNSQQVQLREEVQSTVLRKNIHSLLLNKILCDVSIDVGGVEIEAHRNILAASSPVFKSMFENDMNEKLSSRITISDLDFETINEMVHFMYTGKTPDFQSFEHSKVLNILKAADKYAMDDLMTVTVDYIASNLTVSNVIDVLLVADFLNVSELKEKAVDFICANKSEFSDKKKFSDLKQELLLEILVKMCIQ